MNRQMIQDLDCENGYYIIYDLCKVTVHFTDIQELLYRKYKISNLN